LPDERRDIMLLKVQYNNDTFDMVKPHILDGLISSGQIKRFYRSEGWATLGVDPIRGRGSGYIGTERRRTSPEVKALTFFEPIMDSFAEPMYIIGKDFEIQWLNRAARKLLLLEGTPMVRLRCYEHFHGRETPCNGSAHACPLARVRESARPLTLVHEHITPAGESRLVEIVASPLWDEDGAFRGVVEAMRDIADRDKVEGLFAELQKMAVTDGLTGLYNHRHFKERLNAEFARTRRIPEPLSLLLIDIDLFKSINDSHGHLAGDEILQGVARVIRNNVREIDILARYGGEEFAVILPCTDRVGARKMAERLRQSVADEAFYIDWKEIRVTVSVGAATYPDDSEDSEDLIGKADQALYHSKRSGRNQSSLWDEI
jgi:diguanylate cyclase (GGDEF)-like protein